MRIILVTISWWLISFCLSDFTCFNDGSTTPQRMDCSCAKNQAEYDRCCRFDEYMDCLITNSNAPDRFECIATDKNLLATDIQLEIYAPYSVVPIAGYDQTDFTPKGTLNSIQPNSFETVPNSNEDQIDRSFRGIGSPTQNPTARTYYTRLLKSEAENYRVISKSTRVVGCDNNQIFIKNEEEGQSLSTGRSWKTKKVLIFELEERVQSDTSTAIQIYKIETFMDSALLMNAFCELDPEEIDTEDLENVDLFNVCGLVSDANDKNAENDNQSDDSLEYALSNADIIENDNMNEYSEGKFDYNLVVNFSVSVWVIVYVLFAVIVVFIILCWVYKSNAKFDTQI